MKCERCLSDAAPYVTDVDGDGRSVSRYLCKQHALEAGCLIPPPPEFSDPEVVAKVVNGMREMASALRQYQRDKHKGLDPDRPIAISQIIELLTCRDPEKGIDDYIADLDARILFADEHGRLATGDELPPAAH